MCRQALSLNQADGDDGRRIQAAIDSVAKLPIGANGFSGAVLLSAGQFEVAGQLRISHSGIVLAWIRARRRRHDNRRDWPGSAAAHSN